MASTDTSTSTSISNKKTVLITGCSDKGIGSALALEFQKRNLHVFATARTLTKMSALTDIPNITLLTLDVTSPTSISSAMEVVSKATNGKLDYLVNNSGVGYVMPILDSEIDDETKKMFDVNFWGPFRVIKVFVPLLINAKGCIVNNSSVSAECNMPWFGLYAASKSALTSMGETLRKELSPFGVRVITIMTGGVSTNLQANQPAFKLPEDSLYLPFKDTIRKFATGEDYKTDGPEIYASKVVSDVLGGKEGKIRRGSGASMVSFVMNWLPGWLADALIRASTGLGGLKPIRLPSPS